MVHLLVQVIKYAPVRLQDEGRLVVPPAFAYFLNLSIFRRAVKGWALVFALTGDSRFSYGQSLCENYTGKVDFITSLIVSHGPTTL
jgi:hypothetical protein